MNRPFFPFQNTLEARREVALRRREAEAASGFQLNLQLPEARLIQYDCGKLQV